MTTFRHTINASAERALDQLVAGVAHVGNGKFEMVYYTPQEWLVDRQSDTALGPGQCPVGLEMGTLAQQGPER